MLYHIFESDFILSKPLFEGQEVKWDDRKLDGLYEEKFWHLITKDDQETGDRLFDGPRAERLPWCAPTVNNSSDRAVKVWNYREGRGQIRTYLWLEHWDYVVILEMKSNHKKKLAVLITAYHVDGASTRKKLQSKFDQREN
jgi:hypothetical protein